VAHQFIDPPARDLAEPDYRLFLQVQRTLWDYEPLRATRAPLLVDVEAGHIRLAGRTRTEALRLISAYLVSFIPGVVQVDNEIVSDDQVVREVADALASDPLTAPYVLRLTARYGEVEISGEVTSGEAEVRAVELARSVPIVNGVRSEISIVRPRAARPTAPVQG
jgi:osmotically-inducible protein OsmY